jgi:alpha-beta hydrolase superfamily lysophospholipase
MSPTTLPIHVVYGTHDPVGEDGEGVKRLLDLYARKKLTISSQPYVEARHELVNETNREKVTQDLIRWLLRFANG